MGIKQLYNDNLRKLPNEYGDVSVMFFNSQPQSSVSFYIQVYRIKNPHFHMACITFNHLTYKLYRKINL